MKKRNGQVPVEGVFRAFSDRTRLRILSLLRGGELCVCDLVGVLGLSQPRVSRHLGYLRRAGLVEARKEGLWMHYRLAAGGTALRRALVRSVGECFAEVPELGRDAKRLKVRGCGC